MCLIKVYLTNTKQCRWHLGMFKEHHDWLRHIAAWRRNILQPECFANLKQNAVANAMWRVPRSVPNVVSAGYRRKDVCRPYCGGGSRRGDHLLSTAAATFSYSTHLHLACTLDLGACKGKVTTHYQLQLPSPSPTLHTCTLLTPPSPFTLMLRLLHFCIIRQLFQIQAAPGQVRGKFKDHIQHQIQSGMYAYIGIPI